MNAQNIFEELSMTTMGKSLIPVESCVYQADIKLCPYVGIHPLLEGTIDIYADRSGEVTRAMLVTMQGEIDILNLIDIDNLVDFMK